MIATTRPEMSVSEPTLYVAFELGKKEWKLAMTSGFGVRAVGADHRRRAICGARGAAVRQGAAAVRVAGGGAGGELLRSGPRWVLDSSRADAAGARESGGGFGEHRGESARAAREDGSARCAETGADAGARLCTASGRCGGGARADGGGGGGAPGESRADGVDAGADAADQSDARLAGDVGRALPAR